MKLRKKSFLLVALTLAGVTVLILGVFRYVAARSLERAENDEALRTLQRVHRLLMQDLDDLGRTVRDYGAWDELSDATARADADYIDRQLTAEAVANLKWDRFALVRKDGVTVTAKAWDAQSKSLHPLAPACHEAFASLIAFLGKDGAPGPQHLATLAGELHLVALTPIRPLSHEGPQTGFLIAARKLDAPGIERLSAMSDAGVRLLSLAEAENVDTLTPGRPHVIRGDAHRVRAHMMLTDAYASPLVVLESSSLTTLRESGFRFVVVLMIVVVLGELLVLFLVDRYLLRDLVARLAEVGQGLGKIQRSRDYSARLPLHGRDEIAVLTQEVNHLLASVDSSHRILERMNAEMQQRVAERTAALADANAALEADIAHRIQGEQEREGLREQLMRSQRLEAVGTLAGGIAHDFNNILAGILGHTQIIAMDLPAEHPAQAFVQQVVAAAERAAALVRKILAFSRQTPGERRIVSVGQIARETMSLLRAALPAGISLRCEMQTVSDFVHADPAQLHQVFMNLGTNAGHALGSRGGEVVFRIGRLSLDAPVRGTAHPMAVGDYVCIEAVDNGCGMTREVMDRIFDPFFTTKPVNQGTGLGLAVVHGIVTDHHGTIRVESEPGKGTVFRILLPADESTSATASSRHAMPLSGNERVLVVDDEELVLHAVAQNLSRLGYAVTPFLDSNAALKRFTEGPQDFDLVITDQTMPQISGLALTAALKEIRPNLPVILMTGYSPDVTGKVPEEIGVVGIVSKPIDLGELTTLMRNTFNVPV